MFFCLFCFPSLFSFSCSRSLGPLRPIKMRAAVKFLGFDRRKPPVDSSNKIASLLPLRLAPPFQRWFVPVRRPVSHLLRPQSRQTHGTLAARQYADQADRGWQQWVREPGRGDPPHAVLDDNTQYLCKVTSWRSIRCSVCSIRTPHGSQHPASHSK